MMRLVGFILVTAILVCLVFLTEGSKPSQPTPIQTPSSADADFKSLKIQ